MFLRRDHYVAAVISIACLAIFVPRDTAAVSCGGQSHALTLSNGSATPPSGLAGDRFTFSVTYADNNGCVPERIVVIISGLGEFGLNFDSGDLHAGAVFVRRLTLQAGAWPYRFEAVSGTNVGKRTVTLINVSPTYVTVTTPTPPPTPAPTPSATQGSAPKATPKPSPKASSKPPPSTTSPTATTEPTPGAPTTLPPPPPTSAPSDAPAASSATARPSSSHGEPGTQGAPAGRRSPAPQPGIGQGDHVGPSGPGVPRPLAALMISGLGTITGLGFFLVLGRRLYDPEPARAGGLADGSVSRPDPMGRRPQ